MKNRVQSNAFEHTLPSCFVNVVVVVNPQNGYRIFVNNDYHNDRYETPDRGNMCLSAFDCFSFWCKYNAISFFSVEKKCAQFTNCSVFLECMIDRIKEDKSLKITILRTKSPRPQSNYEWKYHQFVPLQHISQILIFRNTTVSKMLQAY